MNDPATNSAGTSDSQRPVAAFVISLIAGLWMLAAGGMMTLGMPMGPGMMGGASPWMWRHHMMGWMANSVMWPVVGALAGIVTLIGAAVMYQTPKSTPTWGVVILVASAVDLFAGAGGYLAGSLGVVGGVVAIMWKP